MCFEDIKIKIVKKTPKFKSDLSFNDFLIFRFLGADHKWVLRAARMAACPLIVFSLLYFQTVVLFPPSMTMTSITPVFP
jgi:hypothetical protein